MTCEVAVANRLGIALAADSAATFVGGSAGETYSAGANKIFQMADLEPLGCMIYNNANIAGIPWELVIKAYRASLNDQSHDTVQGYADDFIDFVNGTRSADLLTDAIRELSFANVFVSSITYLVSRGASTSVHLGRSSTSQNDEKKKAWTTFIAKTKSDFDSLDVKPPLLDADLKIALRDRSKTIAASISDFLIGRYPQLVDVVDTDDLANLAIRATFLIPERILEPESTGLVVAGYGRKQFMPECVNVKLYNYVGSQFLWRASDGFKVQHTGDACQIKAFAMRNMVETFLIGASPDAYGIGGRAFKEHATALCAEICTGLPQAPDPAIVESAINDHLERFRRGWVAGVAEVHLQPLLDVVGSLSLEELAELADTLVMLESLKEKVTRRTQSVGGPIDVAIITKSEGLVWIKRKLYFEPQLNHRYFARSELRHKGAP